MQTDFLQAGVHAGNFNRKKMVQTRGVLSRADQQFDEGEFVVFYVVFSLWVDVCFY